MIYRVFLITLLTTTLLGLSACETAKKQLGLERRTPDAFAVVKRAPLEIPPDFYLRPPTPGAPRPQEQTPTDQAASVVLGQTPKKSGASQVENLILQQSEATQADPTIRQTINDETKALAEKDKPTLQRLFNLSGDESSGPASIVDAPAEAARLKENKETGKAITDGKTPSLEK